MKAPTYQRQTFGRTVEVMHGEAFQLMYYHPRTVDEACAAPIWIWNSRDGVTPFITFRTVLGMGVEYQHGMQRYQARYFGSLPEAAQFVWVDYTPETWEELQRQAYDRMAERNDSPFGGEAFLERFPTVDAWLAIKPFEPGQPHLITREQYLERTSSWIRAYPENAA